jgi:hypothetical protein
VRRRGSERGSGTVDLDRGGEGDRAGWGGVDMPGRERLAMWLCRGGGMRRCRYARVCKDFAGEKTSRRSYPQRGTRVFHMFLTPFSCGSTCQSKVGRKFLW